LSGDLARAKAACQDFLTLWINSDPDILIFKRAKQEYASYSERWMASFAGAFCRWAPRRDSELDWARRGDLTLPLAHTGLKVVTWIDPRSFEPDEIHNDARALPKVDLAVKARSTASGHRFGHLSRWARGISYQRLRPTCFLDRLLSAERTSFAKVRCPRCRREASKRLNKGPLVSRAGLEPTISLDNGEVWAGVLHGRQMLRFATIPKPIIGWFIRCRSHKLWPANSHRHVYHAGNSLVRGLQ